jgi:hypothetical protein
MIFLGIFSCLFCGGPAGRWPCLLLGPGGTKKICKKWFTEPVNLHGSNFTPARKNVQKKVLTVPVPLHRSNFSPARRVRCYSMFNHFSRDNVPKVFKLCDDCTEQNILWWRIPNPSPPPLFTDEKFYSLFQHFSSKLS